MPFYRRQILDQIARMPERLHAAAYSPLADLAVTAWVTPEPVPYSQRTSGRRLELKPGDVWGGLFDCGWFHFEGTVPPEARGAEVAALIDINGEALVVDAAGEPLLGLTTVNSDYDFSLGRPGKRVVPLYPNAEGGEQVSLWADGACNDLFGRLQGGGTLKEARIARLNPHLRALTYDWEVLADLLGQLPDDSARWHRIFQALQDALLLLDRFTEEEAARARDVLAPELAKRGGDPSLHVRAIGHSHIDLAWLWPIRETIRKGARTFATVLHHMERYPDYVFGASQPQLYAWMKEHYPGLYRRFAERIAEGRIECQGAMWVEPDTNVPGGESLARQLLYGKRYFRQEFGVEVANCWLPDVFGYSGALPQLLVKAGVPYFLTQKLSWSLVNRYPHHTFLWRGIDGSEVLAHLPPEDTYNSSAAPRAILKAERNFADKGVSDECILLFGIGDGGGGPGEEHLERLAREKNLAGLPPVNQEFASRFFERIAPHRERLPIWSGELYLERHQGTLTTQARNKRANRRMEIGLRLAEWSAARARWALGASYPRADFERIWKEVLLYQFHDILPGSSITRVYTESLERYEALLAETAALEDQAAEAYAAAVSTGTTRNPLLVTNALSWECSEWIQHQGSWYRATVPSLGHAVLDLAEPAAGYPAPTASENHLENDRVRLELNADGSLKALIHKQSGRNALRGAGNVLAVYKDDGDAWDFDYHYAERAPERFVLQSRSAAVDGPRASITCEYAYGSSRLTQEIVLMAGSGRVDFRTTVDWREDGRMLRTSFPVNVQTDTALCEIQFGHIRRPAHENTSWDLGQLEVCAQKWADMSEEGFGVALLNDCKYGHRLNRGCLDLNLLRSPSWPDPQADRALHTFTYALYPHAGDAVHGGVVREAYALNVPLRTHPMRPSAEGLPAVGSLLSLDAPNVVVEAVKCAEDSDDLVVRLYECHGKAVETALQFGLPIAEAALVNVLEEEPEPLRVEENGIRIAFRPFEVHTLRVRPA
jgi:alpha-mannosidase